jgi:hypothetical protein
MSPLTVFINCEFTDFIDIDLVSIALVCEDGREFYAERTDFRREACSEFVRMAVLPRLGQWPAFQSVTEISPPRNFTLLGLQVQTILLENQRLSATLAAPLELVQKVISLGTVKYITTPGDSTALTHIACRKQ